MSDNRHIVRQGLWGVINTAVVRGITFFAQIAMAFLLSPKEFGVYAVALSASAIALTLRGAGVAQWQISGGERLHSQRSTEAFWLSFMWNVALGILVVGSARPFGSLFGDSRVVLIIAFIGATFPLQTPSSYFQTRLQIQLRIKTLTIIDLVSNVVRCLVMIACASLGVGAFSFVAPIPICFLLEGVMGYLAVREAPWRIRPDFGTWPNIVKQTRWVMLGSVFVAVGLQGDYVILGVMATLSAVGVYYFAYQLTLQTAGLVAININRVFTSALVSRSEALNPTQFLAAIKFITLAGSPCVLLLGACFTPLEHMVWGAKWDMAVIPVVVLSLGLPFYLLATAVQSALVSAGRFRAWMAVNLIKALFVVGSAAIAGAVAPTDAAWISAILALGLAAAHSLQTVLSLKGSGIGLLAVWKACWLGLFGAPMALVASDWCTGRLELSDPIELVLGPLIMLSIFGLALVLFEPTFRKYSQREVRRARSRFDGRARLNG